MILARFVLTVAPIAAAVYVVLTAVSSLTF
jgi:hypothetical protein